MKILTNAEIKAVNGAGSDNSWYNLMSTNSTGGAQEILSKAVGVFCTMAVLSIPVAMIVRFTR